MLLTAEGHVRLTDFGLSRVNLHRGECSMDRYGYSSIDGFEGVTNCLHTVSLNR